MYSGRHPVLSNSCLGCAPESLSWSTERKLESHPSPRDGDCLGWVGHHKQLEPRTLCAGVLPARSQARKPSSPAHPPTLSMLPAAACPPSCWSVPPPRLPAPPSGLAGVCPCHERSHSEVEERLPDLHDQLPLCPPKLCVSAETELPPDLPEPSTSSQFTPRCPLMQLSSPLSPNRARPLLCEEP